MSCSWGKACVSLVEGVDDTLRSTRHTSANGFCTCSFGASSSHRYARRWCAAVCIARSVNFGSCEEGQGIHKRRCRTWTPPLVARPPPRRTTASTSSRRGIRSLISSSSSSSLPARRTRQCPGQIHRLHRARRAIFEARKVLKRLLSICLPQPSKSLIAQVQVLRLPRRMDPTLRTVQCPRLRPPMPQGRGLQPNLGLLSPRMISVCLRRQRGLERSFR